VPPGTLLAYIQKGLLYAELEAHARADGTEEPCQAPFNILTPHQCKIGKDVSSDTGKGKKRRKLDVEVENMKEDPHREIRQSEVATLTGHKSEVFACSWNPKYDIIATGSGDGTGRVWNVPDGRCSSKMGKSISKDSSVCVGDSEDEEDEMDVDEDSTTKKKEKGKKRSKDVTALHWNPEGSRLATGSYDGKVRIFTKSKWTLLHTLAKHQGPVFALKYNPKGSLLVSGSVDMCTIVWDTKSGEIKQSWKFHTAPVLDVCWRDNSTLASCSTDKTIVMYKVGNTDRVMTYRDHENEVNTIKWDPSKKYLASCSDDKTAKIWIQKEEKPYRSFEQHKKEIYTLRWSPTGQGSEYPDRKTLLATASFDTTVRIWDIEADSCLQCLSKHSFPVYSVAFSPNGHFIASGSYDQQLFVWRVEDGKLVRTFKGKGGIFEVGWNADGDKIAACYSNHTVCVIDFRSSKE